MELAPYSVLQGATVKKIDRFVAKWRAGTKWSASDRTWASIMRHAKKVSKLSAFAQSLACTRPSGTARNASVKATREALRGAARVYADTNENQTSALLILEGKCRCAQRQSCSGFT